MNVEFEPQKHQPAPAVPAAGDAVVIKIGTLMRWSAALIVLFALTTLAMGIAQTIGLEDRQLAGQRGRLDRGVADPLPAAARPVGLRHDADHVMPRRDEALQRGNGELRCAEEDDSQATGGAKVGG